MAVLSDLMNFVLGILMCPEYDGLALLSGVITCGTACIIWRMFGECILYGCLYYRLGSVDQLWV
jgi:hypothetical protein